MSRSGYSDDCDDCGGWYLICWRGAVKSALKGKRGQAALREIRDALDAMPVKELAADSLVSVDGQYCTLGALGSARGMPMESIDPDDHEEVAEKFGMANAMVREIVYENDEGGPWLPYPQKESPSARWVRMRNWVSAHIAETANG